MKHLSYLSPVNEMLAGNKFYLITRDESILGSVTSRKFDADTNARFEVVILRGAEHYRHYKRNHISFSAMANFNYIYRVETNLRLFVLDAFHVGKLKTLNLLSDEYRDMGVDQMLTMFTGSVSDLNYFGKGMKLLNVIADVKAFSEHWDGVCDHYINPEGKVVADRDIVYAFYDNVKASMSLVDGLGKRFRSTMKSTNIVLPDWVEEELIRYTNNARKRINKSVVTWLKDNFKKPYESKTLYRGMSIHPGTGHSGFGTVEECEDILKRYCSVGLVDVRPYASVGLKRGKESSWSETPQIAKSFAKGLATGQINFLFKAEIPADRILLDLSLLSDVVRGKFKYNLQNECIVETGNIKATITDVWYKPHFVEWLDENGYRIVNRSITKKKI
jgi:hypothetical protein